MDNNDNNGTYAKKQRREACGSICRRLVDVHLPVTVKPVVALGKVRARCAGCPVAVCADACDMKGDDVCKFTVVQRIEIELPLSVTVKADAADAYTECCEICLNAESDEDENSSSEQAI